MRQRVPLAIVVSLLLALLVACAAPAAPTAAPTKPAVSSPPTAAPSAPTTAPAAAPIQATTAPPVATPTTAGPKVKRGGQLRGAVTNDWLQFDPHTTSVVMTPLVQVFDPFVDWQADAKGNWGPIPALAESWDIKGKEATFKLRKGVKFHDGSEFNAEVAKWNFERMMNHPKSGAKEAGACIDPAKGVEILDPYTIKLNLKSPCGALMAAISPGSSGGHASMISKAAMEKLGEDKFIQSPSGTGPFQVAENKPGDFVQLKRFDGYWEKGADGQPLPYLDTVRIRMIVDDSVRLLEAKAGAVDLTQSIQGKDYPGVKSNPELVLEESTWTGTNNRMSFSAKPGTSPFAESLKLRQAAWYAIDRESIANTLGRGVGKASKYFLLPGTAGYDDSVPYYWYNPDKAKQLLSEAGFASGIDLKFDVISRVTDQQQAQILKQMLDAVGIRTSLDVMERSAWVSKVIDNGNFQASTSRHGYRADPDGEMTRYVASIGGFNVPNRKNPEIDKCLDQGRSTYDLKEQHEIYKRCQTLVYEDGYYQYLWFEPYNWVMSKKVKGWRPTWGEIWMLKYLWME